MHERPASASARRAGRRPAALPGRDRCSAPGRPPVTQKRVCRRLDHIVSAPAPNARYTIRAKAACLTGSAGWLGLGRLAGARLAGAALQRTTWQRWATGGQQRATEGSNRPQTTAMPAPTPAWATHTPSPALSHRKATNSTPTQSRKWNDKNMGSAAGRRRLRSARELSAEPGGRADDRAGDSRTVTGCRRRPV